MTTRHHLTIAIVVIALSSIAAGCDDGEPSANSPATSETTPSTAPRSTSAVTTVAPATSAATTTAAPTTPPPTTTAPTTPPTIAADDWEAILEELARRRVGLYAAPDVSRIGEYCAPATDCALSLETQLGDAVAKGQHIEGQQPFDVIEIVQALPGEPSPAGRLASVVFIVAPEVPPPARLVDSAGNVVDELSLTTTKTRGAFTLVSWESDPVLPWRVVLAEDLGPEP